MKALGDNKLMYLIDKFKSMFAAKDHTHDEYEVGEHEHNYAGSDTPGGSATSAKKLETGRNLIVDLNLVDSAKFNGSEDVDLGVKGTLTPTNGGTGVETLPDLFNKLSNLRFKTFSWKDSDPTYWAGDYDNTKLVFDVEFRPLIVMITKYYGFNSDNEQYGSDNIFGVEVPKEHPINDVYVVPYFEQYAEFLDATKSAMFKVGVVPNNIFPNWLNNPDAPFFVMLNLVGGESENYYLESQTKYSLCVIGTDEIDLNFEEIRQKVFYDN